jgi:hypothetical protein
MPPPVGGSLHIARGDGVRTNVYHHVALVSGSGRQDRIRLVKIWRNLKGFGSPSFYLEIAVMEALGGVFYGSLEEKVVKVLNYLRDCFEDARVMDPVETNNCLSDAVSAAEKRRIVTAAGVMLGPGGTWGDFVR